MSFEGRTKGFGREGKDGIMQRFCANPTVTAGLRAATFEPNGSYTVGPDGMRARVAT